MVSTWLAFLTLAGAETTICKVHLGFVGLGLPVLVNVVFHTLARIVSLWSNQRIFAECEIDWSVCGRLGRIPG
jgi:hypothetical protein